MRFCKYNNYNDATGAITGEEKPAYLFAETVPADYTDITSIQNLNDLGFSASESFDYKRVRDLIKLEVELITWYSLTSDQKVIATIHKIGTNTQRAAALGNDYDLLDKYGEIYHKNVLEVRAARMAATKSKIHNRLGHIMHGPYTAPEVVLAEVTENVIIMYENEGLGGIVDGDNAEGLLDYINETAGTSYELGAGMRSKPWTPYGYANMNEFSNKLLDILQKGIY